VCGKEGHRLKVRTSFATGETSEQPTVRVDPIKRAKFCEALHFLLHPCCVVDDHGALLGRIPEAGAVVSLVFLMSSVTAVCQMLLKSPSECMARPVTTTLPHDFVIASPSDAADSVFSEVEPWCLEDDE